ncbi:hypothetical protein B7494_g6072 [Chlorociboria aeruginascens]|nr:hypothetical protein B7494_g6072 [Chlorociboria aeruginascens]
MKAARNFHFKIYETAFPLLLLSLLLKVRLHFITEVIDLVSESEGQVEVMSDTQPNSPVDKIDDEVVSPYQLHKCPRSTTKASIAYVQSYGFRDSASEIEDKVEHPPKSNKRLHRTEDKVNYPPKSNKHLHETVDKVNHQPKSNKRRHETRDKVDQQPESNKRSRPTRKATADNAQSIFTPAPGISSYATHEVKCHINSEIMWLNVVSIKCNFLHLLIRHQKEHIATLEALETEFSHIITKLLGDYVGKQEQLHFIIHLKNMEARRGDITI